MTTQYAQDAKSLDNTSLIAVIGAGAMGAGIAQIAAQSGHRVFLYDQNEHAIFKAKEMISTQLHKRVLKGKLSQDNYDLCLENIIPAYSLKDLANVDLIIEAIVEKLDVKQTLFVELEAICKKSCLFTSNTSSISITSIAAKLTHPERFFGLHFFNPAPIMALVEVINGLASDPVLAQRLYKTCLNWGKKPVLAKSNPGFIVNRVARPFYAEALRILEEQGASINQIDELMRNAGKFKMGPFELMDLIGHDVNYAVTESVFNAYYNDPRFKPSLSQKALVEAGFLGRKTGRGFYQYDNQGFKIESLSIQPKYSSDVNVEVNSPSLIKRLKVIALTQSKGDQKSPIVTLIHRLIDANFYIDMDVQQNLDKVNIVSFKFGAACIALTDGRSATERSIEEKLDNLILFDMAFDYGNVNTLAIGTSDDCSDEAIKDVQILFKQINITLIIINDIPGLVLMRTLAMLTNEAVDTCLQGVATAEDIDIAMCAGVNYPQGPILWGQRIGLEYLHRVLKNLQKTYGEERYRPSSLLRRLSFSNKKLY